MISREELIAHGLHDFRRFLYQVWDFLDLPDPTPIQLDIAKYLQTGPKRTLIQAFRGVGKSWETVAYYLWRLLWDQQVKIEVVSAGGQLAHEISKFGFQLIREMPLLQHLEPRDDQRHSFASWDVNGARPSKDPSVKSVGITGQVTGTRADLIIADDVEIPKNSYTHHLREKLANQTKEFSAILKPGGRIVYLGTPQVEDTLYSKLLKRGYQRKVWPSEIPEHPERYRGDLGPIIKQRIAEGVPPHTPTDPDRFDEYELAERLAEYGRTGYALQFMLDTTLADIERHPLKCRDLIVMDVDRDMGHVKVVWQGDKPYVLEDLACAGFDGDYYVRPGWLSDEMAEWQGTAAWIDPSGGGKDETALAIVRYHHGTLYLVYVNGWVDGYGDETLEDIALQMIRYGVGRYVIEKNFGGGMFDELLKPVVLRKAEELRADGWSGNTPGQDKEFKAWTSSQSSKENRILDTLEPPLAGHRLVVDRRVIVADNRMVADGEQNAQQYSLIYQMTRMERQKGALPHDDRIEAVAGAVSYWTEKMRLDRTKAHERHKDRMLQKELDKIARAYWGARRKRLNWTGI